jgi:bacillithiol biosynthesis cysteine-adding enzyme BshC
MEHRLGHVSYRQTGSFSRLVEDYTENSSDFLPFCNYSPDFAGIGSSINARASFPIDRSLLVNTLQRRYAGMKLSDLQQKHIDALRSESCFTICTAHQPNLFTGPLYFIYKIVHAIRLADALCALHPGKHFVPVYYMGSEDADKDELAHVLVNGVRHEWNTGQSGAFGRMFIDEQLILLLDRIDAQLANTPFHAELVHLLRTTYEKGITIEQATFRFVHALFAEKGLLVLLPDDRELKHAFISLAEKELTGDFSQPLVNESIKAFPDGYPIQAQGRAINFFYLQEGIRNRIVFNAGVYEVLQTDIRFSKQEMLAELHAYPERFSPNVLLRPLYQEILLPNVAFIGGGAELAYWLLLKNLFDRAGVFYPVLLLRNSFLLVSGEARRLAEKLQLSDAELFQSYDELASAYVRKKSSHQVGLDKKKAALGALYDSIASAAEQSDSTLRKHTAALRHRALEKIEALEQKMLRAEKKKHEVELLQLRKLKELLFPGGSLQERKEGVLGWYALLGPELLDTIHQSSLTCEPRFTVIHS